MHLSRKKDCKLLLLEIELKTTTMKHLIIFLILLSVIACRNENRTVKAGQTEYQSPAFKYDSIIVFSKNVSFESESVKDTSTAKISYPIFADEKINQFIQQKVLNAADETEQYSSYPDFANAFVKNYDDFIKENKGYAQTWFLDGRVEVKKQKPGYLSLLFSFVNYEGGAHPNSSYIYLNYDPESSREIILDSLIIAGTKPKLTAVAEKIFRKNEKLTATASLKDSYFFENNTFTLNNNFTITDEGLKFLYNPYEIKAYAFGVTELVIPFSDLKDIAKPKSLLNPAN